MRQQQQQQQRQQYSSSNSGNQRSAYESIPCYLCVAVALAASKALT
jgi:hypothetical protein